VTRLRYGLIAPVVEDVVTWRLASELGDLWPRTEFPFRVAGTAPGRAMLPVALPAGSETRVVAEGARGRPARLVRVRSGGAGVGNVPG